MELYSVIKNDGPGGLLFWKFQGEDFRNGSQLIVAENEEALLVRDGVIVESFSGGRFDLTTNNYPVIDRFLAMFSGGVKAFHCKVFFVNKAHALELFWGTDSPVQVRDPVYGIATQLQGRGSYTIKVVDTKKFILKFVANNTQEKSKETVGDSFRAVFMQKIKSAVARGIREAKQEILGICERLNEFSETLKPELSPVMEEYGLEIVNFYIEALDIPQNDPSRAKLEAAFANKAEVGLLGADWQRVQSRDILKSTAENPGLAGAGAGIGMGIAAGGVLASLAAPALKPLATPQPPPPPAPTQAQEGECPACHARTIAGAKFCPDCGVKLPPPNAFCINCGTELKSGAKFCPECGTKQN